MRLPAAIAARMRSAAMPMAGSRNGSCSGCSPARKARAVSGSPYPRRTSTLAVISLRPSAWARDSACRCGHGLIVQVPSCIAFEATEGVGRHLRRVLVKRRPLADTRPAVLDSLAAPAWWRYVTYVVGFLTFATLAALGELNGLLQAMHVPGAASYGIGGLSDFGLHRPHPQAAYDVVLTWCGGQSGATTSVFTIAHWEILVDCVFALLYPALAGIILLKAHRRLGGAPVPPGRAALVPVYRRIAAVALFAVPILAAADVLENIFEWQVVSAYDGCQAQYMSTGWFWALWIAAVIKYLA